MSNVQLARTEIKRCPMCDDGCAAAVIRHVQALETPGFDAAEEIENACGRFSRGSHVGKLRGWAEIRVCVEGGWLRSECCVALPGRVLGVRIADFNGETLFSIGAIAR